MVDHSLYLFIEQENRAGCREKDMEKERILDLFQILTPEDQKIVIELMKYALTLGTVDLYSMIEDFEDYSSGRARFTRNSGEGTGDVFDT